MTEFWKAVRPDGTDFYSGSVRWLPEDLIVPDGGWLVKHPSSTSFRKDDGADNYLSVSTVPTDCTGMDWPCLLLRIESAGKAVKTPDGDSLPNKRASVAWRVVEVVDPVLALGPQGAQLKDLIGQAGRLTEKQANDLCAAWYAAWDAARYAARYAARDAARDAARRAAWDAALDAAWDAAAALAVRDLIGRHGFTQEHYNLLTGPWAKTIGPVHPDDKAVS